MPTSFSYQFIINIVVNILSMKNESHLCDDRMHVHMNKSLCVVDTVCKLTLISVLRPASLQNTVGEMMEKDFDILLAFVQEIPVNK